jgi:hypothetical protein
MAAKTSQEYMDRNIRLLQEKLRVEFEGIWS